jgi:hypothetical protein
MGKKAKVTDGNPLGPCPICGRPMVAGEAVDRHHWQPRSQGGREAQPLHLICHRKLHSLFSEKELATTYATPAAVRQHPQMQAFIRWVRRQPPGLVARHKRPRRAGTDPDRKR